MTDHSKAVTVANGLDEKRMAAQVKMLREIDKLGLGIRVFVGSEVDILKNGSLDYSDETLAQIDVVVCSVHSYMNLEAAEMTERLLAAIENPYTQIIAHPTGRLLLRREAYPYNMEKVLDAWADVLNTLPPEQFLAALRPKPGMAKAKPAGRSK
jgi:DNA polymerase (family 10)